MLNARAVTIGAGQGPGAYPPTTPYRPAESYPELGDRVGPGAEPNHAYALVRQTLCDMGFDRERAGLAEWNPLGDLVQPLLNPRRPNVFQLRLTGWVKSYPVSLSYADFAVVTFDLFSEHSREWNAGR